jgi:FkbM family methyltransferase
MNFNTIAGWRLRYLIDKIDMNSINTICDIGSCDLSQSLEISEIFPEAKIYAFEPCPRNYQNALERLNNSNKNNISLYETALGESIGTIKFYPMDDTNPGASSKYKLMGKSTLEELWYGRWNHYQDREIEVKQNTLDNWRKENNVEKVDLIWIDVQGAELDVFKGGVETLKDVKAILTEAGLKAYYDGQSLKPEIDKFLSDNGFVEIKEAFQYNGSDCEANLIYIKRTEYENIKKNLEVYQIH